MKIAVSFLLFISTLLGFSQAKELSELIKKSINEIDVETSINRIAKSSGKYSNGDIFKLTATFKIDKGDGSIKDILISSSLPATENIIKSAINNVSVPKPLLDALKESFTELKFTLPIRYQVKKESQIIKNYKKKYRKEKRKNK
ncbi:MAG: hypothetical protein HRT69_16895 [Flavobacteriaceae bacterium]|nr:hypothetical protein [Flavobacteriaceae bacterium]